MKEHLPRSRDVEGGRFTTEARVREDGSEKVRLDLPIASRTCTLGWMIARNTTVQWLIVAIARYALVVRWPTSAKFSDIANCNILCAGCSFVLAPPLLPTWKQLRWYELVSPRLLSRAEVRNSRPLLSASSGALRDKRHRVCLPTGRANRHLQLSSGIAKARVHSGEQAETSSRTLCIMQKRQVYAPSYGL